jgi:hypothetical protein
VGELLERESGRSWLCLRPLLRGVLIVRAVIRSEVVVAWRDVEVDATELDVVSGKYARIMLRVTN